MEFGGDGEGHLHPLPGTQATLGQPPRRSERYGVQRVKHFFTYCILYYISYACSTTLLYVDTAFRDGNNFSFLVRQDPLKGVSTIVVYVSGLSGFLLILSQSLRIWTRNAGGPETQEEMSTYYDSLGRHHLPGVPSLLSDTDP